MKRQRESHEVVSEPPHKIAKPMAVNSKTRVRLPCSGGDFLDAETIRRTLGIDNPIIRHPIEYEFQNSIVCDIVNFIDPIEGIVYLILDCHSSPH